MASVELSDNLLVELGGWPALKQARALVERGQVQEARREGVVIRAEVRAGEKTYEPRIVLGERIASVEVFCTCVESRRHGRVCAHALAAGWALLHPARAAVKPVAGTPPLPSPAVAPVPALSKRWPLDERPAGVPALACTVILPLQLGAALGQKFLRVILEASMEQAIASVPWEVAMRDCAAGFAVQEDDERMLGALEQASGLAGISAVPREEVGPFLRGLSAHPRIWLGKNQRIEVRSAPAKPRVTLARQADNALRLTLENNDQPLAPGPSVFPGWNFDGRLLVEVGAAPVGLKTGTRLIPHQAIPAFLARELPVLERTCDIQYAPGFEEFSFENGRPRFEVQLEGTLAGITLKLRATYGERAFDLGEGPSSATVTGEYFPAAGDPTHFWQRDGAAERHARLEVAAAGFQPARHEAFTYSLTHENNVARFLGNLLPRWRREWLVLLGPRLQATLEQVDIAQPEFALRSSSGEDWLNLDLKLTVGGQPVPLEPAEIQRWLQTGQSHARMANRRVLIVPTGAWGEMREVLADTQVEQSPGRMRVPRVQAPFLAGALAAQGFRGSGSDAAEGRGPEVQARLDSALLAQLRPYQIAGVEWLARLAERNFSALLADDMGLGKTVQALSFLAWLRTRKTGAAQGPALVVCPTSLVTNWLRETARFVPHLRALDLTGAARATAWAQMGSADLLVTSYAILRRDSEQYAKLDFSLVVLDEAQHIKNRASQNAQAAKALRAQQRLILTGTPLENSVLDLWSLFDFLLPGYLGTAADFRERYETPLARGVEAKTMERLRHRVRPFFLRRTKEEVLPELPPKLEHLALVELSHEQREVYRALLAQGRRDVFEHSGKAGGGRDRMAVLTTLLRLRQACCHLGMLPSGNAGARVWREPSAKMERTFELIDEAIDGGHRVLLFSQFVRALHLLRDEAQRREIPFAYLDGQTLNRQGEVDRFQRESGLPLFLISLKAGGTGLNLTGADTIIHFDPWWNPAVEEQATARAHRLGQSRAVQAYKLIAAGTVEQKIQALQARKRELFAASVGSDEAFAESLTGDELGELLAD